MQRSLWIPNDMRGSRRSPQLVDDADQHEEGVLADSLLEGVRAVAETGVCARWSRPMPNNSAAGFKAHGKAIHDVGMFDS